MEPRYFATPADFRRWLARNHAKAKELLVGFHKVGSGTPSITWPQSVDEALAVGWIDGVRKRVDDERYTIRFTPRRAGSIWSAINIARVAVLEKEGRMTPAGMKAFAARNEAKSRIYAYEQVKTAELSEAYEKRVKRNKAAWDFLKARPPWYRHRMAYWVMTAKQEETRVKRLEKLIVACAAGKLL